MVSKITLFEPHFHDSTFGPTIQENADADDVDAETEEPQSGRSTSAIVPVLMAIVGLVVGGLVLRRLRGGEEELEVDAEGETEIELEA